MADDLLDYNPETDLLDSGSVDADLSDYDPADFLDSDSDDAGLSEEQFKVLYGEEEEDPTMYVMNYYDILSGRKMLTDFDYRHKDPKAGHGFTTHANGMMFEVEGKRSEFFRGDLVGIGSFPWDLVDYTMLLEVDAKERLMPYLDEYFPRLQVTLQYQKRGNEWDDIKTNLPAIYEFIQHNLKNLRCYIGRLNSYCTHRDGAPVLQYIDKPKTLIYFAFGVYGVVNRSRDVKRLLEAPLDEPVKRPRELQGLEPELKRQKELENLTSHGSSEGSEDSSEGSQDSSTLSLEGDSYQSWVLPASVLA